MKTTTRSTWKRRLFAFAAALAMSACLLSVPAMAAETNGFSQGISIARPLPDHSAETTEEPTGKTEPSAVAGEPAGKAGSEQTVNQPETAEPWAITWETETLSPEIDLPTAPKTREDFNAVFQWMLANREASVTFTYLGETFSNNEISNKISPDLCAAFMENTLVLTEYGKYRDVVHPLWTIYHSKDQPKSVLTLTWDYAEGMESKEAEAMEAAGNVLEELYTTGHLDREMSEYDRAKALLNWLTDHVEYDLEAEACHTAWGALCGGRAVCDGYTGAYNLLLKLDGIECCAVTGYSARGNGHVWTNAVLDDIELHIDATWCDSDAGLEYFAIPWSQMSRDHFLLTR